MRESPLLSEKIHELLQVEPAIALLGLVSASWVLYKILLRSVSAERHQKLRRHFKTLFAQSLVFIITFVVFQFLDVVPNATTRSFVQPYVGVSVLLLGAVVFISALRVMILEYLFLGHMTVGVPLLLVNLFTLLASLAVGAWLLTEIFGLRIAPVLATSALFSIVLGLAMQDTLGNLFAGIALQIDKPYEIGHWIEVQNGTLKWTGQVDEISWRATVLVGLADELMTIPNRVMAQAQISNFSMRNEPFARSQLFKIAHTADLEVARNALLEACKSISGLAREHEPVVFACESSDTGVALKLIYFVKDYGAQFRLQDEVTSRAIYALREKRVPMPLQNHAVSLLERV
ncbi:MAG: hypothetical protein RJB38_1845 [Pseudomonadota bacterium]|jgi:small-conductance mechanosensitive channel